MNFVESKNDSKSLDEQMEHGFCTIFLIGQMM